MVPPVGAEITAASLLPKLEELPMLQLLETPSRFSSPPSTSCPPSIAGSPPGSANTFGSYQLPSTPATTSYSLSTSCGSSPPKSMSPGYHQTPKHYQSQPNSPHDRSPRTSISDASGGKQKVPRHKRPSHINAEHRRRCKIQVKINTVIRGTVNLLILFNIF